MHSFKASIQKFNTKGQQTGWHYVEVPPDIITKLKLKNRKEFRIKGLVDDVKFERMTCFPSGEGNFILVLKAEIRKKLGKNEGALVSVKFEKDNSGVLKSQDFLDALKEEPLALAQFNSLTMAHQNYFHNHINAAKGIDTKAGRIVQSINAMLKKQDFGEMIRSLQKKNN
ncbi:hypothetical protein CNR22_09595 [Sphingobacteriaceae bacterium]|nr:hypothetical protein CNR22_09595 [Sphingobacteriaceae bacterium]